MTPLEIMLLILLLCFVAMIVAGFIRQIKNKRIFRYRNNCIHCGMLEKDLLQQCGTPFQSIVIDEHCKLISYTLDEWMGFLFYGIRHSQITATIKDGKVAYISSSWESSFR